MPKGIMGNWGFSSMEGNSKNKCIYAFSFLVGKHREPQSINDKLFVPTIPIGMHCRVRFYAFVGQPLSKQLYWVVLFLGVL